MAILCNKDGTIYLNIQFIQHDEYLDISETRSDFENFIPFDFVLHVEQETYSFPTVPTFTLYEIKSFLQNGEKLIATKKTGNTIEEYTYCNSEAYFDLSIYDTLEGGEFYLDLWINLGSLTQGKISGYKRGYRFVVELGIFEKFFSDLKENLATLLSAKT